MNYLLLFIFIVSMILTAIQYQRYNKKMSKEMVRDAKIPITIGIVSLILFLFSVTGHRGILICLLILVFIVTLIAWYEFGIMHKHTINIMNHYFNLKSVKLYTHITCCASAILAILFAFTLSGSNSTHKSTSAPKHHKTYAPKTVLQVDGQQVKSDTKRDKTFSNGTLVYNIHTDKGIHLDFDPTISHKSAYLTKVSPSNYQVKMTFNADDSSMDNISGNQGYTETLTARSKGHRSTDIDLGANDTKDEVTQIKKNEEELAEHQKQEAQQEKQKRQAKLAKDYPQLSSPNLDGISNDQMLAMKYRVSGTVDDFANDDDDDTEILISVPGSDRDYLAVVPDKKTGSIGKNMPITVYGEGLDKERSVTSAMVDNGISSSHYTDQLIGITSVDKIAMNK